ncbi:MAG: Nif3-like dinuclear metal center hexameric protein [Clostridia bacterium]|nr:Nif3-like dinuclear metal center hexameric protein [Clostridia bacterium]
MTVNEIYSFLNGIFPTDTACDFDNPGLLVGNPESEVTAALIALDCTLKTVETAKENNCNLIITHHPIIFEPLKKVTKGSIVFELVSNGIAVISMHTNMDMGENGVNDCLCNALEFTDIKPIIAEDGYILKCGKTPVRTAVSFAAFIKSKLGGCVKFVDGNRKISNVLVCSGSGGDFINEAIKGGFDAFVTADIKHHHFLMAADRGISLFDAGHFNTEDVIVEPLKALLSEKFPDIEFIADHISPIKYI